MSTAANHRKRSHRSQRAHYRERETQIMSAAKYIGMRKNGLFIELKRIDGGRVSAAQMTWIQNLSDQGYRAVVCNGWECAAKVIGDYLGKGKASPWD